MNMQRSLAVSIEIALYLRIYKVDELFELKLIKSDKDEGEFTREFQATYDDRFVFAKGTHHVNFDSLLNSIMFYHEEQKDVKIETLKRKTILCSIFFWDASLKGYSIRIFLNSSRSGLSFSYQDPKGFVILEQINSSVGFGSVVYVQIIQNE